jgi:hypothetical protein
MGSLGCWSAHDATRLVLSHIAKVQCRINARPDGYLAPDASPKRRLAETDRPLRTHMTRIILIFLALAAADAAFADDARSSMPY